MAKRKEYVIYLANYHKFVTKIEGRGAWWEDGKEPKSFCYDTAEQICNGLLLNGHFALLVCAQNGADFFSNPVNEVSHTRLEEICSNALHYIHEELDLRDFEESYDIDFDDDELMYFGFADLL